jgi:hypothetical protein
MVAMVDIPDSRLPDSLYSELKFKHENEIRLVQILPLNPGNHVICKIRVVDLLEKPEYAALSYTWGPSSNEEEKNGMSGDPTHRILCNGYPILVTENLHNFLTRAARSQTLRLKDIWIDAISVNQKDLLERTKQVSLMANIYQSAANVTVWMGNHDDHTENAFNLMKQLSKCSTEQRMLITPKTLESEEVYKLLAPCHNIYFWKSLGIFFQRRWFTRVWVIQEVTLATKANVICGEQSIDWDDITKISRYLTLTSWTRWLSPGAFLQDIDTDKSHHGIPTILRANSSSMRTGDSNILLYSLIRSRRFIASDWRDKVYAILGVAGDSIKGKDRYLPVYGSRPVAETYTLFAIQILEDATDLLLLTCAEGDKFRNIPSLPSWVPDWSSAHVTGLGVTGYKRFSAAGEIPRSLTIDENNLRLSVRGQRLDEILLVGESKHEVLQGKPFPQWLGIFETMPKLYHTGQTRSEVFWRTLITNSAGYPPTHPAPPETVRAFTSWIEPKLRSFVAQTDLKEELLGSDSTQQRNPDIVRGMWPIRLFLNYRHY